MKTLDIIEGMWVLSKYYDGETNHIIPERDILYMYATDREVSSRDLDILVDMGWEQEDGVCDSDGKFLIESYDVANSWCCYP